MFSKAVVSRLTEKGAPADVILLTLNKMMAVFTL